MVDFAEPMATTSDDELYLISQSGGEDYQLEAVAAAKQELARRNLAPEILSQMRDGLARDRDKALRRLSWLGKAAFFVLPAGILSIVALGVVALGLSASGYTKKSEDAHRFMGRGILCWALPVAAVWFFRHG